LGGFSGGGGGNSDASTNVPVLPIIGIAEFWASFFDWLFGGSSAPPTPRQLLHGRHPLYPVYLGVPDDLTPSEDAPILMIQAIRGDDPGLGLEGPALDAEIRRLSKEVRSLPNGKERNKKVQQLRKLLERKSKRAHGADKFSWIPIVPEAPLAAESGELPEAAEIVIEILEFAL